MREGMVSAVATMAATIVLGFGLAGPADGGPADAAEVTANPAAPTARGPMTRITLRVKHCRRCPVYLQQALDDGTYWTSKTHRVRAGHARFRVPTKRTHGMTFALNPRWSTTNAVTNVVTRYANTRVGQHVSNRVAAQKRRHRLLGGDGRTTGPHGRACGEVQRTGNGRRPRSRASCLVQTDDVRDALLESHLQRIAR